MSVRKLTNVQEARRILRKRRARCQSSYVSVTLRFGRYNFGRYKRDLLQLFQAAQRRGAAVRVLGPQGSQYPEGFDVSWLAARRLNDGRIKWTGGVNWNVTAQRAESDARDRAVAILPALARQQRHVGIVRPARCPCSAEELVAIDTLLEKGDAFAEHLAKECKRGGGILEGSRRHRRRR